MAWIWHIFMGRERHDPLHEKELPIAGAGVSRESEDHRLTPARRGNPREERNNEVARHADFGKQISHSSFPNRLRLASMNCIKLWRFSSQGNE